MLTNDTLYYGKNAERLVGGKWRKLPVRKQKEGTTPGIPLDLGDSKVIFGFLYSTRKMDESVARACGVFKEQTAEALIAKH